MNTQSFKEYRKTREKEEVLWKDRRRYLGMPLSFTRYRITTIRLSVKKGLFNTKIDDILLYRILDIEVNKKFWQRIFGVGTIVVHASDRTTPLLELKSVKRSETVADYLSDLVEMRRDEKHVTGREMFGAAASFMGDMLDADGDGIPDHLDDFFDPPPGQA